MSANRSVVVGPVVVSVDEENVISITEVQTGTCTASHTVKGADDFLSMHPVKCIVFCVFVQGVVYVNVNDASFSDLMPFMMKISVADMTKNGNAIGFVDGSFRFCGVNGRHGLAAIQQIIVASRGVCTTTDGETLKTWRLEGTNKSLDEYLAAEAALWFENPEGRTLEEVIKAARAQWRPDGARLVLTDTRAI